MKTTLQNTIGVLAVILMLPGYAHSQELSESLSSVTSEYARFYVRPLTDALGADYNTGLFHSADNGSRNGLHFYLGIAAFATIIDSEDEQFSTIYDSQVMVNESVGGNLISVRVPATFTVQDAPTIFGREEPGSIFVQIAQDTSVSFQGQLYDIRLDTTFTMESIGGLIDLPAMPAAAPQLEIGTFHGTDVMIRYVPSITNGDVGTLGLFGAGIRHSISQYIPAFPFHVAVQGVWQKLFLDDVDNQPIVEMRTWAANIQASKQLGILTIYGGLQLEDSHVDVSYQLDQSTVLADNLSPEELALVASDEPVNISLDLDGANSARVIGGFSLRGGPFVLATDFNFGTVRSASVSFGLTF